MNRLSEFCFVGLKRSLWLYAASVLLGSTWAWPAETSDAMATAHRWVAAKFLGQVTPNSAENYLLVFTQSGEVGKNQVQGHHFRIANQEYSRGLHFSSDGKVRVVLSGPARSFEAVVGADSNDIGYYSNVGRGAAVASVETTGKTAIPQPGLARGNGWRSG